MNYGQQQAIMVLAGERLGFPMATAAHARVTLEGKPVHPMHGAAVEKEATELHNKIRAQADLVTQANKHCADLIAEFRVA